MRTPWSTAEAITRREPPTRLGPRADPCARLSPVILQLRSTSRERNPTVLKVHVLDRVYRHSSNVAHGVEVPAGARLLFTNGQTGTRLDGTAPETAAEQTEVAFERLREVLKAARMDFADVVRFDVYFTDRADLQAFVAIRDRVMGTHKPGATFIVVAGLARPELKIEIEAVAAKVD